MWRFLLEVEVGVLSLELKRINWHMVKQALEFVIDTNDFRLLGTERSSQSEGKVPEN